MDARTGLRSGPCPSRAGDCLRTLPRDSPDLHEWLEEDYRLGRGHGTAIVHVITKGQAISTKHVGSSGSHRDESDTLWLDGSTSPASPG